MTTKHDTAPQEACACWTLGHEKTTSVRLRMNPSMNRLRTIMTLFLSLY